MADKNESTLTQTYTFPELGVAVEATDLKSAETKAKAEAKKLTENL